jgi:uncharacterized RDD family membrane protein YckC
MRGGRLPFAGGPSQVMAGHLLRPPDLAMLPEPEREPVARALEKDPRARWESCREFVEAVGVAAGFLAPRRHQAWARPAATLPEAAESGPVGSGISPSWDAPTSGEIRSDPGSDEILRPGLDGLDTTDDILAPEDGGPSSDAGAPPPAYAGAWRRMVAATLDNGLHTLYFSLYGLIVAMTDLRFSRGRDLGTIKEFVIPAFFLSLWVSKSIMYMSRDRATLGMKLMRINIVTADFSRLSFRRAMARELCKFLSILPLFAGYLPVIYSARKQAWHDRIAGTLVVEATGAVADGPDDEDRAILTDA